MPGPRWRDDDAEGRPVFQPEHLLREARRQRGLPDRGAPATGVLAFAAVRGQPVVCFGRVTNTMGQQAGPDFERSEAAGAFDALRLIAAAPQACQPEAAPA